MQTLTFQIGFKETVIYGTSKHQSISLQFGLKDQTAVSLSHLLGRYMKWSFSVRIPAIWIKSRLQQELDDSVAREEFVVVLLVQETVAGHRGCVGHGQVKEAVLVLRDRSQVSDLCDDCEDITFLLRETIKAQITKISPVLSS